MGAGAGQGSQDCAARRSLANLPLPPHSCLRAAAELVSLSLTGNALGAVPPALAGASALQHLALTGNPLALSAADAELLLALPSLASVQANWSRASRDALRALADAGWDIPGVVGESGSDSDSEGGTSDDSESD